jgi:hypothetical protein
LSGTFSALALLIGFARFWRNVGESYSTLANPVRIATAAKDIFTLVNLDNGGDGCSYPQEKSSESLKWFHHATFYGFLSCFIATTLGAFYYFVLGSAWAASLHQPAGHLRHSRRRRTHRWSHRSVDDDATP